MKTLYAVLLLFLFSFISYAQDLSKTMIVKGGTSVSVASGTTLYVSTINLKSTSTNYSCLLLNGALDTSTMGVATVVNYDRYVDPIASGNDLISLPVKDTGDVTFGDFLNYSPDGGVTPNSDLIPNHPDTPTIQLFGPYDNGNHIFRNYDTTTDAGMILERAQGYRAATNSGQTLRFTGTVTSTTETTTIVTTGSDIWNCIGNPYPTYINSQDFLVENLELLEPSAAAIYGYNSYSGPGSGTIDNYTITNFLTNTDVNIAPGQGFFVANKLNTASSQVSFTTAMRTFSGTDDFILGRSENPNQMLRLRVDRPSKHFTTEIYFNDNSTLGLDPGYDAQLYGSANSNLRLYSRLVQNDIGENMAIQSLSYTDLNDVIIPLGLNTEQGSQVTFSIETSTLPAEIQVYLEDSLTNTFTLLNTGNYTFTANTALSGVGRFFLRIGSITLSNTEQDVDTLNLYTNHQTLYIKGLLLADTKVFIYDLQGRLVLSSRLKGGSNNNSIRTSEFSNGIYIVKLNNEKQAQTNKVIFK